jgi:hypothetical protein
MPLGGLSASSTINERLGILDTAWLLPITLGSLLMTLSILYNLFLMAVTGSDVT